MDFQRRKVYGSMDQFYNKRDNLYVSLIKQSMKLLSDYLDDDYVDYSDKGFGIVSIEQSVDYFVASSYEYAIKNLTRNHVSPDNLKAYLDVNDVKGIADLFYDFIPSEYSSELGDEADNVAELIKAKRKLNLKILGNFYIDSFCEVTFGPGVSLVY